MAVRPNEVTDIAAKPCVDHAVGDHQLVPLTSLRRGERAVLCRADLAHGHAELLNAMGLAERCEVCVCRGGEPCIVRVNATRLGLSAIVARRILVARRPPSTS